MRAFSRSLLFVLALALWACGDDPEPRSTEDGGTNDGSIRTDTSVPDAGDRDTSTPDANVDAETPPDAAVDAEVDSAVDGGDACATAVDGEPCTVEGTFCGGPCTDVCSFCNIIRCEGGRWSRLEVFPAPCFDCGDLRCQQNEQLCRIAHSDVGGEPDAYSCEETPDACVAETTCECIEGAGVGFDRCTDETPGQVTVEWFGG